MQKALSRRDFLKLSGLGFAALALSPLNLRFDDPFESQQGRVTTRMVWAYAEPSLAARKTLILPRDAVVSISNTAASADDDSPQRVWYELGKDGYVSSENIQPVRTTLSAPYRGEIPKEGLLAEVCVPYSDAFVEPNFESQVGYRVYYETTHWIQTASQDSSGQIWYQILEDKYRKNYYVRAEHLRVMTAEELAPLSPDLPSSEKKIRVLLERQWVIAYEAGKPIFSVPVSTGARLRSGTYTTPSGKFITSYKRPSRHMAAGEIGANGFDLPGVPWVQYITKSGISFHGTFWHNNFGATMSHGCINMTSAAAKWLYRWSSPSVPRDKEFVYGYVGTQVEIA
ncbi:MAG: L,D-transpeptidase [Anaerolineales bacterium]|nr:L,D-transpeptidase [Anaerolineales bacterium]